MLKIFGVDKWRYFVLTVSTIVLLWRVVGLLIVVLAVVLVDVSCVEVFVLTCVASFTENYEVVWCSRAAFGCWIAVVGYEGYARHFWGSAHLATVACTLLSPFGPFVPVGRVFRA